jgi:3-dehydroquinate synthase
MADAAIGGKTAIDHALGKNLIGAFHPPEGVVVDPDFLATLPTAQFRDGVVEIYKTLLVGEGDTARAMAGGLERIVRDRNVDEFLQRAIRLKQEIVARDPRESGERRVLNFGHTLGHAIENAGAYRRWSHGEAVAIGMAAALLLSADREGFSREDAAALSTELVAFSRREGRELPEWNQALESGLQRDKKSTSSGGSGILLSDWGKPVVREVPPDQWKEALLRLRS